jgi:formate/nitrite transporter
VFGVFGFPFAFMAIVVCGAELFTSQSAYTTAAWLECKIPATKVFKMLFITWCGNFVGCIIVAYLFHAGEIYHHKDMYIKIVAHEKLHLSWKVIIIKGIFANWLVGIATWMANSSRDLSGKAIGVWLPISSFAAIGYEHCIANMFVIMMAIFQGMDATFKEVIWNNLIPATIGNYIGGGVFVAALYSFVYGNPSFKITKDRLY